MFQDAKEIISLENVWELNKMRLHVLTLGEIIYEPGSA